SGPHRRVRPAVPLGGAGAGRGGGDGGRASGGRDARRRPPGGRGRRRDGVPGGTGGSGSPGPGDPRAPGRPRPGGPDGRGRAGAGAEAVQRRAHGRGDRGALRGADRPMTAGSPRSLVKAATIISAAAVLSRILGYVREMLLAARFGATYTS